MVATDMGIRHVIVGSKHSKRFAGARLTVGKDSGVETLRCLDQNDQATHLVWYDTCSTFIMSSAATAAPFL